MSLITLGVADVPRARRFYEALGFPVAMDVEETVFLQAGALVVTLWSRAKLAEDSGYGGASDTGAAWGGITLAHNVGSDEAVDAVLTQAEAAGATVAKPGAPTFYGGYAGVFHDPDGHAWEIAHNPGFGLADDGSVTLPPPPA